MGGVGEALGDCGLGRIDLGGAAALDQRFSRAGDLYRPQLRGGILNLIAAVPFRRTGEDPLLVLLRVRAVRAAMLGYSRLSRASRES